MSPTRQQLGRIIREARLERGLTIRQAAEALKMDWGYYGKIETGQNPLGKHARPIAKLLGLDAADLEALAAPTLPNFAPYLRAKYDLDDEAIAELESHFAQVSRRKTRKRGQS